MKRFPFALVLMAWLTFAGAATAEAPESPEDKVLSGMSIVGNDEAPKSLVIVPWKTSELSDALAVSRALDDGRGPIDREVFQRGLAYYRVRAGKTD